MPQRSSPTIATTPRAWQRMLSGRRLDLLAPNPDDIEISDIAHGLARVARWNGQTLGGHALSVAQHSLVVLDVARDLEPGLETRWQRAALLHDAAEYVIGDLISPFKAAIGFDYKSFELKLLSAVHARFEIPEDIPCDVTALIKEADQIAAYFEATGLAGFDHDEARAFFGTPDNISNSLGEELRGLAPLAAPVAQELFLERFFSLS